MLSLKRLREVMKGEENGRLWLDRKSNGDALVRLVKGLTDPQSAVLELATAPDVMEALYLLQEKVCGHDNAADADTLLGEIGGVFNSWLTEDRTIAVSPSVIGWRCVLLDPNPKPGTVTLRDMPGGPISDALNKLVWCLEPWNGPLSSKNNLGIVGSLAGKIARQAMETMAVIEIAKRRGVVLEALEADGLLSEFEAEDTAERALKEMGKQLDTIVSILAAQGMVVSIEELRAYMANSAVTG